MHNLLWLLGALGTVIAVLVAYYAAMLGPWIILYLLASQI